MQSWLAKSMKVVQIRLAISRNLHMDTFCDRRVWMKGVFCEFARVIAPRQLPTPSSEASTATINEHLQRAGAQAHRLRRAPSHNVPGRACSCESGPSHRRANVGTIDVENVAYGPRAPVSSYMMR